MINNMIEELVKIDDDSWKQYAFRREPLVGKISPVQQEEFCLLAQTTGRELAAKVRDQFGAASPEEIILALGIDLKVEGSAKLGQYSVFAVYEEPNTIIIWQDTIAGVEALLDEGSKALLEGVSIRDILLAHELYHFYEYSTEDFPTSRRLLELWRFASFSRMSRVGVVGELGAMAFAKELLGIGYSPYVLDALLLYPTNRKYSLAIYDEIMQLSGRQQLPEGGN